MEGAPDPGDHQDNVDETMTFMSEEGPMPKKNYRDALKRRTGAEQFNEEHSVVIESKASGDCIADRIKEQIDTVPKLNNELNKKKSITTITTIKTNNKLNHKYDPSCSACAQILTYNQLKKLKLKPRCHDRPRPRRNNTFQFRRVSRTGNEDRCKRYDKKTHRRRARVQKKPSLRLARIWINKGCQYSTHAYDVKESKFTICPSIRYMNREHSTKTKPQVTIEESANNHNITPKQSDNNGFGKVSRDPSVSTYNSFLSLDHEPMD